MTSQEFHVSSEVDSRSQMSLSAASPDHARVLVELKNGIKVLIPIHQNSTVNELHEKAVKRAAKFGIHVTQERSYLQTSGKTTVALCGEDSLGDVWDWTEDATFILCDLEQHASLAQPSTSTIPAIIVSQPTDPHSPAISQTVKSESMVFVRLLTLEETISNSRLRFVNKDVLPLPDDTALSQLHASIVEHYQEQALKNRHRTVDGQQLSSKVNLYLQECRLDAESNPMSLRDMKLTGSRNDPLNIFVDLDYSTHGLAPLVLPKDEALKELWGFETTRRGICTFVTSLEVLLQGTKNGTQAADELLNSLLEVTHFPPLLIAFKTLTSTHINYKPDYPSMRLLAWAIHLLCLQTAPSWFCATPDNALESSRQVISWLCSLGPDLVAKTVNKKPSALGSVQIRDQSDKQVEAWREDQALVYDCELSTVQTQASGNTKVVVVKLIKGDKDLATFLAHAINQSFSTSTDFYFDATMDWDAFSNHQIVSPPQPSEFNLLLETTSMSSRLRTISPDKLAKCTSKELPVITLSTTGYISTYDQEDYACGQLQYFTWNAADGKEVINKGNPGQYLMQKLSDSIIERKKTGAWMIDAWGDWTATADFGKPDEAVIICMDTSLSMNASMDPDWMGTDNPGAHGSMPSRLTEVKEFFKNLASRISALQLSTYLGLVTFSDRNAITVRQELTPVHLNFEDQMEEIKPQSQTAIYDGIEQARKMLSELKKEHKDVKCRIVVLTDGQDNQSAIQPAKISKQMYDDNVVVDSIVIGTGIAWSRELFRISRNTGGYAFAPKDQRTFFQIFLLETMVDIRTRPDKKPVAVDGAWTNFAPKTDDMADPYHFPPSRPHPNQGDYFIALKDAERFLSRQKKSSFKGVPSVLSSTKTTATNTTISSGGSASRVILSEIKEMVNNPHPYMDVYISESNMGFWLVAMQGPPDSPYSKGTFKMYLELGADFPVRPPSARFITPMLHPNITKHGRICHPILDREWTGATRVYQILQHIWGILVSIEARDAVDPLSALKLWTDPVQGRNEVERYVKHFATKSRAAIQIELFNNDSLPVSSAASVVSDSTVTDQKGFPTPSSSVISGAPPSYRSQASNTLRSPGGLRALLGSRPHRSVAASPPPLMVMSGQDAISRIATQPIDQRTETGSVTSTSTARERDRKRRSLFGHLKRNGLQ